jgi:PAS domain S-box-containing protein
LDLELSASDDMYRRIVEAVPDGIWIVDPQGRTVFSNRPMAEILGIDFESMPGQSCFAYVYPDELVEAQLQFARGLAGDRPPFDFRLRRADGSPVWVSISCMPMLDDAGSLVGMLGLFADISDRKRAEAELRESEERFRNMADNAPVMIWVAGPDKMLTFFNKTWLDFTGRTLEQELGVGWTSNVHPEDMDHCFQTFSSAFDARRTFQIEYRLRAADGEYRWMLCKGGPRFAPDGTFLGYIGSDIEITDLQSEQRFRQLAENIDQIFWMLDLETNKVLYVSPAFEKIWGRSSAALYRDRNWILETVHVDDRARLSAILSSGKWEPLEEVYRIVRPDGSVRWIKDRSFPVYDAGGKLYRLAGIAEDITSQREMEEELRQAHKMEAVGRFAGGIAHDFNNLLTVIAGYSQMLLEGDESPGPRRERLGQILSAANRAGVLTKQLLAFTRQQPLQPQVLNINHLLSNMETLLRRIIGEHIAIETELDPSVGFISVDPHQLEQVVMNLAVNARDAMPNGGRFRIETSMADPADMQAGRSPHSSDEYVRITISDTGCGMDNRTRERAFEPFFTTKEIGKGTGLGLSIVYGIVQQNQGTIHLYSEPGQGTVFELLFPTVPEGEEEFDPPADRLRQTDATETILVAEDEPAVRALVREALEQFGYTVLEATDGYDALRVVEQHQTIHLLLTDVIMPLMNGHELAQRLQAIRPEIRVLYMSGYTDDTLAFHGITDPEIEFIQKPFTKAELGEKVRLALAAGKDAGARGGMPQ